MHEIYFKTGFFFHNAPLEHQRYWNAKQSFQMYIAHPALTGLCKINPSVEIFKGIKQKLWALPPLPIIAQEHL